MATLAVSGTETKKAAEKQSSWTGWRTGRLQHCLWMGITRILTGFMLIRSKNGGKVHKIRPSVIHLMRGQVFEIDGKSIFAFGGASSHDIAGGILEPDDPDFKKKKKELDRGWYPYRINHVSWWKQELPSEEEMQEGIENLAAHDNKVDFIVTHCCASSTQTLLGGGLYKTDILTEYHEKIRQNTRFKKWFFGHYHDNRNVNIEEILIYEQMIRIS